MKVIKPLVPNKWYYSHRGNGYGPFDKEIDAIRSGRERGSKFVHTYYFLGGEVRTSPNKLYHVICGQPL